MTMQADFMKMPFSDSTFDAIFAIEATCHAPDVVCHIPNLNELSM
jgi:sterol 24-C-methyltransferase